MTFQFISLKIPGSCINIETVSKIEEEVSSKCYKSEITENVLSFQLTCETKPLSLNFVDNSREDVI